MYQYFKQYNSADPSCFWGISNDIIFTTFITIGIFIVGYIANRRFENWKENKRLKDFKKYFISHLNSLLPKIDKQILEYKNLSDTLALTERKDLSLGESLGASLVSFRNLPFNDIYKIFITNTKNLDEKKYEMYQQVIDCLNFFDRQLEYAQRNFNEFFASFNRYESDWEESSDMILRRQDEFISLIKRVDIDVSQDIFLKNFAELVREWHQNKDWKNLDVFENVLLEPLRDLCKNNISDLRSIILLNLITKSSRALVKLKHTKKYYSEYYAEEAKHLDDKKELFIKALKYFD